ncbi:MAG: hypothetical protein IPI66_02465 [Chitinophagaceae bacterium]|nr:hypothetical protein [Chitinophagaceae bacterium]MBL0055046.1 hypothetical protein [Chitinophagaceae bacterium]
MKKPFLLFTIKCAVILYFAACTSIEDYTVAQAATPVIIKGAWKVNLFLDTNNDQTNDFAGYSFTFTSSGDIKAVKNGIEVNGNWAEDQFSKSVNINLSTGDPALVRLNNYWKISSVSNGQVDLMNNGVTRLNIASL